MLVSTPKLKIPEELRAAARRQGVEIARSPYPSSYVMGSRSRDEQLELECRQWAIRQSSQIRVPTSSPGCLFLFLGCLLFGATAEFGEAAAWLGIIGLIVAFAGASMLYNKVLGVKTPEYISRQVSLTLGEVAQIALQSAREFDRRQ